ncbi:hypothetical protein DVH24_025136 [Malus domestica]|uniref:Uncharacterized protein n=1 Tax=Malus domestica TaxID=3750 RepID=A0A498HPZ1_MALDO|nr:hypothetical protein DVH24_025136 [Malus domestica]
MEQLLPSRPSLSRVRAKLESRRSRKRRKRGEMRRGKGNWRGGMMVALGEQRKKPRTHRGARREEEEAGLSKSHGLGRTSLRTFKKASSPHESPLVPLKLVPAPIKHGTVVQSSPVPPKEVKQTPP